MFPALGEVLELGDVVDIGSHRDVGDPFEDDLDDHRHLVFTGQPAGPLERAANLTRFGHA